MTTKKGIIAGLVLLVSLFCTMPATACTSFDISIEGVTGQEVTEFTMWFAVGENFTLRDFTLGDAVPEDGWEIVQGADEESIVYDGELGWVYKVNVRYAQQEDSLRSDYSYCLVDGELFSFKYDGLLEGMTDVFELIDISGDDLIESGRFVYTIDDNGIVISAVPIPPAFLLLGTGLAGIFAMRRRRSL